MCLPEDDWEDITEVSSHPIALMQCREFLNAHPNIKAVEAEDTAKSAEDIFENKLHGHAAICGKDVAAMYGLKILQEGIETNKHNSTRFLILANRWHADELRKNDICNKSSFVFTLPHTEGSLSQVLSILSYYKMNLTKIQSLPIIGREWEYQFYIDVVYEDRLRYRQAVDAITPLIKNLKYLENMPNQKTTYNITPANRVNQISEYYFSKKLKEVADMNARGLNVISLGIGSPDRPPHPETIETLCRESRKDNTHGYQPYVGIPELRQAFAEWYKKWYGVNLNPTNEIQPLIGSKEGILHISLAFLNPGDGVLVPNPGYPTYTSVSRLAEARILPYELREENNWQPDFESLEKTDLSGVKLMWVNYPHMPTGAQASRELFEKLVDFGRRHNIIIVNDNPYSFILNDTPLSLLSIPEAKEICIEMNSMSKSHNMPGWRIGMLASNAQFVSWILRVKSNIDSGTFRPMQEAAAHALSLPASWYEGNNLIYQERRGIAEKIVEALGCTFDKNQRGMFLWAKIPDNVKDGAELADKVLYEAHVFITPGIIFGSQGERYVRISLCADKIALEESLKRIKNHIRI